MPFLLLMPSYNQGRYIVQAVESCLAQDDPDWELWILDNSTDNTPALMQAFKDPRIHFIHEPQRMDPGACLNRLLEMAEGTHFSYVHTDNCLCPNYVRELRQALSGHPLALAYCDYYVVDADGQARRRRRRPSNFTVEQLFSVESIGVPFAATTALARDVGGFSSDDLADDVYFVMLADGLGPRVHVGKPLLDYRVHSDSRAMQAGTLAVLRSMYRGAVKAYGLRRTHLPDPFAGMDVKIARFIDRAARTARVLARDVLGRIPADRPIWIRGTAPMSFWLAWACVDQGRAPGGFLATDTDPGIQTLLGLPVISPETMPAGHLAIRPRRGPATHSVGPGLRLYLRWLARGLPPKSQVLRYFPSTIISSLLIPLNHRSPGYNEPVWVSGSGPAAAYLAYGLEMMAQIPFAGWVGESAVIPGGAPSVSAAPEGARVWNVPGQPGDGVTWQLRAASA